MKYCFFEVDSKDCQLHSCHSYWWVKKSWWFAVKKLLIIVLLISTLLLMRKCWCLFFSWSLKTNIKSCFYTVSTFCFSFLATLTKAKYFNHRKNLMINTWTKVCLGKTILCVQTQKKGWWWQRSTIFLSLPLSLFFLVMIVKKAKKKATPKTAHYQPLLFSVKYYSYDTKQYFGKQNEKQLMKTDYWLLLSDIIRCQEEKCKVCALR